MIFKLRGQTIQLPAVATQSSLKTATASSVTSAHPTRLASDGVSVDKLITAVTDVVSPQVSVVKPISIDKALSLAPNATTRNLVVDPVTVVFNREIETSASDIEFSSPNREHANFQPLNDLHGISSIRPILLSVTDFESVFSPEMSGRKGHKAGAEPLTEEGVSLYKHLIARNLVKSGVESLIADMKGKRSEIFESLESKFRSNFQIGAQTISQAASAFIELDKMKQALQIDMEKSHASKRVLFRLPKKAPQLLQSSVRDVESSIVDLFVSDFKFNSNNAKNFTDSKLLFQLGYELSYLAGNFSYSLINTDTSARSNDSTIDKIIKNEATSRDFETPFLNRLSGLTFSFDDLTNSATGADQLSLAVQRVMRSIEQQVPVDARERVLVLSHVISKEARMSRALSSAVFLNRVKGYGFDPNAGPLFFSQVIGDMPDTITDVVPPTSAPTLTGLLQLRDPSNVAVLSFERGYIDSQNGTFTPGSEFLVDSILNFTSEQLDISNLRSFSKSLDSFIAAFNDVSVELGLVDIVETNDFGLHQSSQFFMSSLLAFIGSLAVSGKQGDESTPSGDAYSGEVLAALLELSSRDLPLRSYLYSLIRNDLSSFNEPELSKADVRTDLVNKIKGATRDLLTTAVSKKSKSKFNFLKSDVTTQSAHKTYPAKKRTSLNLATAEALSIAIRDVNERGVTDDEIVSALNGTAYAEFLKRFVSISQTMNRNRVFDASRDTRFSKINYEAFFCCLFEMIVAVVQLFGFSQFSQNQTNEITLVNDSSKLEAFRILAQKMSTSSIDDLLSGEIPIVDAFDPQVKTIAQKLDAEEITFKRSYTALIGFLSSVLSKSKEVVGQFDQRQGKFSDLFSKLSKYLTPQSIKALDKQQIVLALEQAIEASARLQSRNKTYPSVAFLDELEVSDGAQAALISMLREPEFRTSSETDIVKILSVGVPAGFTKQLHQRTSIANKSRADSEETDVLKFKVYKRDLEMPDVIFTPREFLFELTRFVPLSLSFDTSDPTTTSERAFNELVSLSKVLEINLESSVQQAPATPVRIDSSDLFTSKKYSFLNSTQKNELTRNHIVSSLLALYLKALSGITFTEQSLFLFPQSESESPRSLIDKKELAALVNFRAIQSLSIRNFDVRKTSVDALPLKPEVKAKFVQDVKHLAALAYAPTNLSDPAVFVQNMLEPKVFERIFHINVDPDDFEIDATATTATEFGEVALHQLVAMNKVKSIQRSDGTTSYQVDRTFKDAGVVVEQYFVTIETANATEV